MSRRMIQSLDVERGRSHVGGRKAARVQHNRPRTGRKSSVRGLSLPPVPLYTTYDICEMLVEVFLKPKDVIESRRLARNLWMTYHLQVGNRVTR